MADIFISYASEDRDRVIPIVKALEEHGWSLFWDSASIPVGKTWRQFIDEGLEAARCIMVIWSLKSVASEWVLEEADEGKQRKILVPALIDDARPPRGFGQIQAARLIGWKGESSHSGFQQLMKALTGLLGPPREQVHAPEPLITAPRKSKPNEAPIVETKVAEPERSKPKTDIAKPPRKFPAAKIGALFALAVVIIAGAIMLYWQEPTKSKTETSVPQVKPEEPQKTPEPTAKPPTPEVKAPEPKAATPEVKQEPPAATKPSKTSPQKKFTNTIGMEFVFIPAGSFTMGSNTGYENEEYPHDVKISQPFYLQTTEVSQGQWKQVMGHNPSKFSICGDDCPVERVSWDDARDFIGKLNHLENTKAYRLPSEAEWEYACRAGTTTKYSFGDDASRLSEFAWNSQNSERKTHAVGDKKPNAWGLYDMHGNVWEWVEDDWHESYTGAPNDGSAWTDKLRGSGRVMRGGGWGNDALTSRSAMRIIPRSGTRSGSDLGFRLAMSVALGP